MSAETIVDEAAVADLLGVSPHTPASPDIARATVVQNIGVLNAVGARWLHAADLIATLNLFAKHNDLPLLADVARQLAEATNTKVRF